MKSNESDSIWFNFKENGQQWKKERTTGVENKKARKKISMVKLNGRGKKNIWVLREKMDKFWGFLMNSCYVIFSILQVWWLYFVGHCDSCRVIHLALVGFGTLGISFFSGDILHIDLYCVVVVYVYGLVVCISILQNLWIFQKKDRCIWLGN